MDSIIGTVSNMEDIISDVRARVDPSDDEVRRLNSTAEMLESRVLEEADKLGHDVEVVQTGSTARGTWVSGDRDIDLFVLFDPSLSEDELESRGIELGERVLPDGDNDFASHPYRVGEVDGFDIDLVPCFAVDSASNIKSAVDRTPFHTLYLEPRMDEDLASDVRVTKMFLKGIGAYGSDVLTQGFSGYLTELLVLETGGFANLLEEASNWNLRVQFDPENHGAVEFEDELVVIDPTDPERNVAANLSEENLLRFMLNARRFLKNPNPEYFERGQETNMSMVRNQFDSRGSEIVAIRMSRPDIVDDTLFPQMRRTRRSLVRNLEDRGFTIVRSMDMANEDTAVMFVEVESTKIPNVERVDGPPVTIEDGVDNFIKKYEDRDDVVGPFIDGHRLFIERQRDFNSISGLLNSDELRESVAMRDAIESAFTSDDCEFLFDREALEALESDGFSQELTQFFSPNL